MRDGAPFAYLPTLSRHRVTLALALTLTLAPPHRAILSQTRRETRHALHALGASQSVATRLPLPDIAPP